MNTIVFKAIIFNTGNKEWLSVQCKSFKNCLFFAGLSQRAQAWQTWRQRLAMNSNNVLIVEINLAKEILDSF